MLTKKQIIFELEDALERIETTYPQGDLRVLLTEKVEVLTRILDDDVPEEYDEIIDDITSGIFWLNKDIFELKSNYPVRDKLYKDEIISVVGEKSLYALKNYGYIRPHSCIEGRILYEIY